MPALAAEPGVCNWRDGAAWTDIPSSFVIPTADRSIPPDAQRFMAERAGSRRTVEVQDASHAVAESQPAVVAEVVLDTAEALTPEG